MADDTNVSAPAAGAETPAAPAAATPAAPAQVAATPATTPASGATPGAPGEGWVPSYRIREAREAAIRQANEGFAQREAQIQAEAQRYRQQVEALVGVTPRQNTEADQIKQQFFQLFPWAKKLEDRFGDFEQVVDRAGELEAQNSHYWTSYGKQTLDRLYNHAADSLGAPLTDAGKRQLHAQFIGFVQSSPEMEARYASDPSIVEDFWKEFTSNFIDPVRRGQAAAVAGRAAGSAALPQDTGGGTVRGTAAPQLKNLDERADAAWALYNASKKP